MGRELSDLNVIPLVVRLDADLHAGIKLAAQESKRSLNSEVVMRLRESLDRSGQLADAWDGGPGRTTSQNGQKERNRAGDDYPDALVHQVSEALPELNFASLSEQAFIDLFRTLPADKQLAVLTLMK